MGSTGVLWCMNPCELRTLCLLLHTSRRVGWVYLAVNYLVTGSLVSGWASTCSINSRVSYTAEAE